MGGRSSKRMPGSLYRRGPAHDTGLQRADQMGSIRMLTPSIWMRNVAWPTGVTRSAPFGMRAAGGGPGEKTVASGESDHAPLNIHRQIHRWRLRFCSRPGGGDEASGTPGLKYLLPSK
jgi:hypothetical protein